MKEIGGYKFMDVRTWERMCERLFNTLSGDVTILELRNAYHNIMPNAKVIPENFGIKSILEEVSFFM